MVVHDSIIVFDIQEKNFRWKFIFPLKHLEVFSMTGSVVDEHLIHLVCDTSL